MEGASGAESDLEAAHFATAVPIFARYIGIDTSVEKILVHIASQSLVDLPDGWELGVPDENVKHTGFPYFFHVATGERVWIQSNQEKIIGREKSERARFQKEQKVKEVPWMHNMQCDVYVGESITLNQIEETKPLGVSEPKKERKANEDLEMKSRTIVDAVQVTKSASFSGTVVPSNNIIEDISYVGDIECHQRIEPISAVHISSKVR